MSTFRDNFLGLEITLCQLEEERMTEFDSHPFYLFFQKTNKCWWRSKKAFSTLSKRILYTLQGNEGPTSDLEITKQKTKNIVVECCD
jgi:hypothetical protein